MTDPGGFSYPSPPQPYGAPDSATQPFSAHPTEFAPAQVEVDEAPVAPFYLLFDVSYSMEDEMGALNQALRDLKDQILRSPILADIARVSVMSFSDSARVDIPMMDLARDTLIGSGNILETRGATSFAAAFDALRRQIAADVPALKAKHSTVYRPMVFFVTDGYPTEDDAEWQHAFNDLVSATPYPNIIPFGFGDANAANLAYTTHPKRRNESFYFIAKQGMTRADSIAAIAKIVVQSVVSSTQSAADGSPKITLEKAGTEDVLQQAPAWDTV
ncbi:VWA domain-containing protein (plasmid) [Rhodococcus opacus]|uniref:vWA domain-containing protein n=1 Tax=Rhodococcus opacus TaxID=37919 RepID=UPI0034D18377